MCVRVLLVYIILSLPVCIFNLSLFTEVFEVMIFTSLVMLSKVMITSSVRAWVTWDFHQSCSIAQTAVSLRKELYHEWSAEMMSPSNRLITSTQAWTCNDSSVPGVKDQLQGNLRVSIRIWQFDFSSQLLQVKKKGERMKSYLKTKVSLWPDIEGVWKSWKPGKDWQSVQGGKIKFNTKLIFPQWKTAWLLDKTKSIKSNYRKVQHSSKPMNSIRIWLSRESTIISHCNKISVHSFSCHSGQTHSQRKVILDYKIRLISLYVAWLFA